MKKFKIVIEEHVSGEFEIEAEDMGKAFEIAEKNYYEGKFVLEPGNVTSRFMFLETTDGEECSELIEF